MTRRRIAFFCLAIATLLVALTPWTIRSDKVVSALARQLKQNYGVALRSDGALTFALLPLPHFRLTQAHLASADGAVASSARQLGAQIRLLPLLLGKLRLYKVALEDARVEVVLAEAPTPTIPGTIERLRSRLDPGSAQGWAPRIDRFVVTDSEIVLKDRDGRELARLRGASLMLNSPEPDGHFDLTAAATWNGEQMIVSLAGLDLAAIREGRSQQIEAEVESAAGRLSLAGRLLWTDRPGFVGQVRARAASVARLSRWTGLGTDLGRIDRPASLLGELVVDLDKAQMPRASIAIGADQLDGAVALQFGARPQIRGTLAGEAVDLGWIGRLIEPSAVLGADYDLRLSASSLTLGPLRLRDAAISVQSSARSVEVSLGRGGFAGGALRGRVSATLDGAGRDMRAVAWGEGIELERALPELTGIRGVSGIATGQVTLEANGPRGEKLAGQLRGRGSVQTRDGELSGGAFGDAVRRNAQSVAPEWRGGRVRFRQADLALDFSPGRADVTNGVIETTGTRSQLSGHVGVETLVAALRMTTRTRGTGGEAERPGVTLEVSGPLRRLTLGAAGKP